MKKDVGSLSVKELAGLVGSKLAEYGIEAVLSGGACVTIYSSNKYLSFDLDFVSAAADLTGKKIKAAMEELGFAMTPKRYFANKATKYLVEFISYPLSVGSEPVKSVNKMKTKYGEFKIISPTDCVKDRLSAFFHWNDKQSLEQAVIVAKDQKTDLKEIKRWAKIENNIAKYDIFLGQLKK